MNYHGNHINSNKFENFGKSHYSYQGNKQAVHSMALMMVIDAELKITDEYFNRTPNCRGGLKW